VTYDELSIARPLDEVAAEHLDRCFADRTGPDRALAIRGRALDLSLVWQRDLARFEAQMSEDGIPVPPRPADVLEDVLDRADQLAEWLARDIQS
jgi:hypothetical protein